MSVEDLLSQDEIDALLFGVTNNDIETEDSSILYESEASPYDFANQDRVVRGRLPTLDLINERFARFLRSNLFNLLRRSVSVTANGVQMLKYSEYAYSLVVPTSITVVKMTPLTGNALLVMDPKVVFRIVDNYFGGGGRFQPKIEGRDFAPTELRIISLIMNKVFADLAQAWKPIINVNVELVNSEVNPQFAHIVNPTEAVVVSTFLVEVEGQGGEFHITMPYSMLEPIRNKLDSNFQGETDEFDARWSCALRDEIEQSSVELNCRIAQTELTLRKIMELKAGDEIPLEFPDLATICVEGIPVLRGRFGALKGTNAVKIREAVKFPKRELRSLPGETLNEY